MASSSTPVHPARYLSVFLILLVGVYLFVFLTGSKRADPKLGIDLQGGTRVTLTARTPDGSRPTRQALSQAQQIISDRVNGLGVSGSEVIVDGDNLVITVPGNDGSEARNLGQTARLYIRPVINALPAESGPLPQAPRLPGPHDRPRLPLGRQPGGPVPGGPAPGLPAPGAIPGGAPTPGAAPVPGHVPGSAGGQAGQVPSGGDAGTAPGGLPMPGDLPLPGEPAPAAQPRPYPLDPLAPPPTPVQPTPAPAPAGGSGARPGAARATRSAIGAR